MFVITNYSKYLAKKNQLLIFLFIFFLYFIPFSAIADEKTRMLRVGVSHGYHPYYFYNQKGIVGIFPDIIKELAIRLNWDIEYIQYPWARMLMSGKNGAVDAVMPVIKTSSRSEYLVYTDEPIFEEKNILISLNDSHFHYDGNLKNIHNLNVGIISGYSYGEEFDSLDKSKFTISIDEEHLIKMLIAKRIKVIIGNIHVMSRLVSRMKVKNKLVFHTPPISITPLYLAFSKAKINAEKMAKETTITIRELKKDGTYLGILNHYGFKPSGSE